VISTASLVTPTISAIGRRSRVAVDCVVELVIAREIAGTVIREPDFRASRCARGSCWIPLPNRILNRILVLS
jgi:hypothetical protein